jgi:DDE superfamily endonuclease
VTACLAAVLEHVSQVVIGSAIRRTVASNARNSKKRYVIEREPLDFPFHMKTLTDAFFKRLYRLGKQDFTNLVRLVEPELHRAQTLPHGVASSVIPDVMLAVTLRYLAGAKVLDLSWPYGLADSTVYAVIDETLDALNILLNNIKFAESATDCENEAAAFQALRGSPMHGFIAAVDGIAIAIHCPKASDSADARKYFNRKGFFSISVQAAVSASYRVTFISAKHAGSTHDSTAFSSTALFEHLLRPEEDGGLPKWAAIAADDAYGNGSAGGRIVTPYSGRNLDVKKDSFNFYLSSLRIVVEQVFGVIVSRWGILWSPLRCSLEKSTKIIVVCAKLHNFILDERAKNLGVDSGVEFEVPGPDPDNDVQGDAEVYLQDLLHMEPDVSRHVRQGSTTRRD